MLESSKFNDFQTVQSLYYRLESRVRRSRVLPRATAGAVYGPARRSPASLHIQTHMLARGIQAGRLILRTMASLESSTVNRGLG